MKKLIDDICLASRISRPQAEQALQAVLRFFGARLPSPVVGRIHDALLERDDSKGSDNAGNRL